MSLTEINFNYYSEVSISGWHSLYIFCYDFNILGSSITVQLLLLPVIDRVIDVEIITEDIKTFLFLSPIVFSGVIVLEIP